MRYIPCAILELSGTIPELVDKVGVPTLRMINSAIVLILTLCMTYISIPDICVNLHCLMDLYHTNQYFNYTYGLFAIHSKVLPFLKQQIPKEFAENNF